MGEKETIVFSVYQYAYGGREINENFEELIRYMKRNHIVLSSGHMVISGRACALFTDSINEKLTLNQSMYFAK